MSDVPSVGSAKAKNRTAVGVGRYLKESAIRSKPMTIIGIDWMSMRRRPMRSIKVMAIVVKRKFVPATVRETRVGFEKPTWEKIVAEKYIREF